jgi:hypothetical protein
MAEPWVRVHANLAGKPVVTRAMEALGVNAHEAMGLLVQFWGAVSQYVQNGSVADQSDSQIERWGGWTRKRGKFAAFIRASHLDSSGRVNEWDEYAGKLEQRRATERDRLREKRSGVAQQPPENVDGVDQQPDDVAQQGAYSGATLVSARADEDETLRSSSSPSSPGADSVDVASRLASAADRSALDALLLRVPSRVTWLAEIQASLDGMSGHAHVTPIQAGQAIRDYVGNGATANPSLKHFRGYLEKAAKPASTEDSPYAPRRRPATNGGARNDAAIDAAAARLEARHGQR